MFIMFYIDDKNLKVFRQEIFVGKFINNGDNGSNICIKLEFINNQTMKKGYLYLNAGSEKNDDINVFVNKKYEGIPFSNDNAFLFF